MQKRIYLSKEKELAKRMISAGRSYREVREKLGMPKSTLSTWFGKTLKRPIDKKALLKHLANIRKLAVPAVKNKWRRIREEQDQLVKTKMEKEIKSYPLENVGFYKSLLATLYWAEGAKHKHVSGLNFVNTDPKLLLLYITLLRKCYKINESKFRIRLHIHYYHKIKKVKKFWSKTLNVPLSQFNKSYIKKRSVTKRFRKNFSGICFVKYLDSNLRRELMELNNQLWQTLTKAK